LIQRALNFGIPGGQKVIQVCILGTRSHEHILTSIWLLPQARVSLARAAYSSAEVVLLDDPLSALDSYVGKKILEECLLEGPLAKRTRVLVTHALHVLDQTDRILVMDNGKIVEEGTYLVC